MSVLTLPQTQQVASYPYETAGFYEAWWRHLAPKFDLGARSERMTILRKPVMKGLLALKEMRIAGWNNAWNQDMSPERVENFLDFARDNQWDYFRMKWNRTREAVQAFEPLCAAGYEIIELPAPPEYVIDLHNGFDGYFNSISHNTRKSFRRKVRRSEHLNPELFTFEGPTAVEDFFEVYFKHHIAYWDAKSPEGSYFHNIHEREFIVEWSKQLQREGRLILEGLRMNGELVTLSHSIVYDDTLFWLLTINTDAHQDAFPGIVALHKRLEKYAAEGHIKTVNMGSGDYFYKVQAANGQEQCTDVYIANPKSLLGKLYVQRAVKNHQAQEAAPSGETEE